MNAAEWLTICQKVEARWGQSRRWDRAGDLALDESVAKLDVGWAVQALDQIAYDEGAEHAPSPVKLIRAGRDLQETSRRLEQGLASCRHRNWAFLDSDTNDDGKRHGTCVACGAERWFAPGKLLTETEREQGIPLEEARIKDLTEDEAERFWEAINE